MFEVQLSIIFMALGAFIVMMVIFGIQYLLDRRKKVVGLATPRVMILGVQDKDGKH